MSETNGHHATGARQPKPLAFEYRRDDGRTEVVTITPERGALNPLDGHWAIGGRCHADGVHRYYRLTSIVMFFGLPDLSSKSPARNLDGTLREAHP